MALSDWIDKISDRWATIPTHKGGTLRAYKLFEVDDFPEAINPPCVLTYPTSVSLTYSTGGPVNAHWVGRSDFYLFDNVSKSNFPQIVPYFERIMIAAFGSITLSDSCLYFMIDSLDQGSPSIQGPVDLIYGDEAPRHGLVVNWKVKDSLSGLITVAA